MNTAEPEKIYQKLATGLNDIIPADWQTIYFYGEVLDDSSNVFFYFNTMDHSERYIYSHDISETFDIPDKEYRRELFDLHGVCEELREEFRKNNQELWTNFTMIIDHTEHFKIDYSYDDLINAELFDSQRQMIWEYELLGMWPTHPGDQKFMENYLKNRDSKPSD